MKSKLWVKILIPILIVAVIGGIWIVKNVTEKSDSDPADSQNNAELSDSLKTQISACVKQKRLTLKHFQRMSCLLLLITVLIPVFLVNRWLPYWKKQIKSFTARHL